MCHRGEPEVDFSFLAKCFKGLVIELRSVISDDGLRQSISAYDGFPYEFFHICCLHEIEWLSFYPFGKIVDRYDQELILSCFSDGEAPEQINSPLAMGI